MGRSASLQIKAVFLAERSELSDPQNEISSPPLEPFHFIPWRGEARESL